MLKAKNCSAQSWLRHDIWRKCFAKKQGAIWWRWRARIYLAPLWLLGAAIRSNYSKKTYCINLCQTVRSSAVFWDKWIHILCHWVHVLNHNHFLQLHGRRQASTREAMTHTPAKTSPSVKKFLSTYTCFAVDLIWHHGPFSPGTLSDAIVCN